MENTFSIPIIPENDQERLEKLFGYNVLETYDQSGSFQQVALMAAHIFKVPIALVSFVDALRVVFRGNVGMEGTEQVSRGVSLCSLAILSKDVTVFKNAKEEACLLSNPLVTGSFGLRFYAAAPLQSQAGFNIGSVCIVDKKPRDFTLPEQNLLKGLASFVMEDLESKKWLKGV